MLSFRIRPRIRCVTPLSKDEILSRFNTFLKETDKPIRGKKLHHHIELRVAQEEMHYWSPVLNITFDNVENGTSVKGRFGPEPRVWTLFMFFYFLGISISFFTGLYLLVQLKLGHSPWGIWLLLGGLLLLLFIYLAAQVGQRKGHEQTEWLLSFCDKVLKDHTKAEPF